MVSQIISKSVFVLLLLSQTFGVLAQGEWVLDMEKAGIRVYTRYELGSEFKSFKAITSLDSSLDEIIEVLKDADNYSKWYGFTKNSRLLKQDSNVQYNYLETTFPWPYKNRDLVYRMSVGKSNADSVLIQLEGIPDYVDDMSGIVRMQKAGGYISLKAMGSQIEITYFFHSEPGDNIPVWLANHSIAEMPYRTLTGLRAILKREVLNLNIR
ncbi:MAG: START domain-containing protein [bacterium]|nr:START domain-containing protein [bacterium]